MNFKNLTSYFCCFILGKAGQKLNTINWGLHRSRLSLPGGTHWWEKRHKKSESLNTFFQWIATYQYCLEVHVLFDMICGFKDFPLLLKHANETILFQIVLKILS